MRYLVAVPETERELDGRLVDLPVHPDAAADALSAAARETRGGDTHEYVYPPPKLVSSHVCGAATFRTAAKPVLLSARQPRYADFSPLFCMLHFPLPIGTTSH